VIGKSPVSERVKIWSDFMDQTKLVVHQAVSDRAEAEYTVQEIEKMMGGISYFSIDSGRSDNEEKSLTFADFAVFYRLSAQSQPLIEAFERSGIPYQSVGQTPFYEYKEVRELLAYLWFLHNPDSTFHLETVLPKKKQRSQMISFLRSLSTQAEPHSVASLIGLIHRFTLEQRIHPLEETRTERAQQLVSRAAPFANRLADFLESTVLQKETDLYDPRADRVTLMTLHAAKGLEFPVVFIVGCEEGLLPYQRGEEAPDLEEERRLFYVGMTRAQQKLILTHAKTRFLFGQRQNNEPSRFLNDIENALKEFKEVAARKPAKAQPETVQLKLF
jgi:DNA helicase-2/ATP-dependent DNA helicase PcrA